MQDCYIAFGSNLGDRQDNIRKAIARIESDPRVRIVKVSSVIESQPQGGPPQGSYLNCVAKIQTSLAPEELLDFLQDIESKLGRIRGVKNGPRTIDLDILLYGDRIISEDNLQVPHPRMFERQFVLGPLLEIEPGILDKKPA